MHEAPPSAMSKDNLAFRKYGIRPSADWERWHDAKDSFPNGSVPHLDERPGRGAGGRGHREEEREPRDEGGEHLS